MAGETIELHVALLEAIDTPEALNACRTILSVDEQARAERFVQERHRRQYIYAHGQLRLALSNAAPGVAPAAWSFTTGRYGRPFVTAPPLPSALHFSLSHTEGCVACVVSGHETVGIDVEAVTRRGSPMEIAQGVFAPDEIETLRGLPPSDLINRFFDYWTLKEAYLKAKGVGLNLPLDGFSMLISTDKIGISFKPQISDDPLNWRFALSSPSPNHRLAIADGSGVAGGLPVIHRPWQLPGVSR
jgi:4'-phosphopantetheinyl transferase